jgi:peptidyl-prolyl cis-trans isomerase SDCCAG10
MASIYSTEPPTSGKVILKTNYGNIDIELWTKEAPRACRNFIQLCLEGYYHNVIFHRIIKGFMIQTGDPTGTGAGGESTWGKEFQDEFHSRLRFSHRGIVAMANNNKPNTNGSQFFLTMDKCSWLDKKHTIFGKITGDTIFNAISISDLPTKDDFPIEDVTPKIIKTEVIINPFIDIVPREAKLRVNSHKNDKEEEERIYDKKELQAKKLQKLTNANLISFDSDEDGIKPSFLMKPLPGLKEQKKSEIILIKEDKKKEINNNYDKDKKVNTMVNKQFNNFSKNEEKGFEFNLDEKFFKDGLDEDKILQYLQLKSQSVEINNNVNKSENQKNNNKTNALWGASASSGSSSEESDPEEKFESENLQKKILEEKKFLLEKGNEADLNFDLDKDRKDEMQKIKQEILIIKKRLKNKNEGIEDEDLDDKPNLTPLQEMRMKYLKNKRPRNNKEKAEKLNEFVKNLKTLSKQEGNWMSNKLKFHTDSQKAFNISDTKEKVMRNFNFNK